VITLVTAAPKITSKAATTFTVGSKGSFTVTATGTPTPALAELRQL
jgi:large repetitive protein